MDVMPGRPEPAAFAGEAAGPQDRFDGASDDEVLGVLCAWDRVEAPAAARKHAAVAELIRSRKNCIVIGVTSTSRDASTYRRTCVNGYCQGES